MKSKSTLRRTGKSLRKLIDTTDDPYVRRVAYAMETAIRWAALDTVGWPSMEKEALVLAKLLRDEVEGLRR